MAKSEDTKIKKPKKENKKKKKKSKKEERPTENTTETQPILEKFCKHCKYHDNNPSFCRQLNSFISRKHKICEKFKEN